MNNPKVIGRIENLDICDRAETEHIATVEVPFCGAAIGEVTVKVYKSLDVEDRDGVVISIDLRNDASSFIPYAENTENGINIHMAGQIESKKFVAALKGALNIIN